MVYLNFEIYSKFKIKLTRLKCIGEVTLCQTGDNMIKMRQKQNKGKDCSETATPMNFWIPATVKAMSENNNIIIQCI